MEPHRQIPLKLVEEARIHLAGVAPRTPLLRLNDDGSQVEVYLKLESLQPTGAFKLRGACSAMAMATDSELSRGVYTASSGNMAQAVAWNARRIGVECTVVVPDTAPATKVAAVSRLGARIVSIPFDEWWQTLMSQRHPIIDGHFFLHPSSNANVMAGYGSIGMEILEDLPDVDAVLVPWGSGGLACATGSVFQELRPQCKVYAVELDTGAPLAASLEAGVPVDVPYTPSFVDGISGPSIPHEMFPLAQRLLNGSLVVSLDDIVQAIRLLVDRNNLVAEGAGAAPIAAATKGLAGEGKVVCIVTGGNIDAAKLSTILRGEVP